MSDDTVADIFRKGDNRRSRSRGYILDLRSCGNHLENLEGGNEKIMDHLWLEYKLKLKGISNADLAKAQNWSNSTLNRRLSGESDWTVTELQVLLSLGFSVEDLNKIFFDPKMS